MSSLAHTVLFYLTVYVQGRMTSKLEKNLAVYVNIIAHKYTFLQRLHSSDNVSLIVHWCCSGRELPLQFKDSSIQIFCIYIDSEI
jgi:hypothetical protein